MTSSLIPPSTKCVSSGEQLSFSWNMPENLGQNDFISMSAHQHALQWLHAWQEWPESPRLRGGIIVGPAASGKTHLIQIWAEQIQAVQPTDLTQLHAIPENAVVWLDSPLHALQHSSLAQESVFHLCNRLAEGNGRLLLSERSAPARWQDIVADVTSRLSALPVIMIAPPDDALIQNLLIKHFADRQIRVNEDVIHYLTPRIERSYQKILDIVILIDQFALQNQQKITLSLVRKVLTSSLSSSPDSL